MPSDNHSLWHHQNHTSKRRRPMSLNPLSLQSNQRLIIEICLEDAQSVASACKAGADRVELCSDLFEGGCTPSLGMFRVARRLAGEVSDRVGREDSVKINVMIRPRGGDFCYSNEEFQVMLEDARVFKAEGADGIVFGILTPEGNVDMERSRKLIEAVKPLPVTFHRAFDMTCDPYKALDDLIALGVDRILTSGQEATVVEGLDLIEELIAKAGDRIIIMPGCGISERNFEKIKQRLNAREYHVFLPYEEQSRMSFHPGHIYMGGLLRQSEFMVSHTSCNRVSSIMGMVGMAKVFMPNGGVGCKGGSK